MKHWKHLLVGAMICLLALLIAGCETTFPETEGKMTNQSSSQHVKPYRAGTNSNGQ